jgi:hypothetical protein
LPALPDHSCEAGEVSLGGRSQQREGAIDITAPAKDIGVHRTDLGNLTGGLASREQRQGSPELPIGIGRPAEAFGGFSLDRGCIGAMQMVAGST